MTNISKETKDKVEQSLLAKRIYKMCLKLNKEQLQRVVNFVGRLDVD